MTLQRRATGNSRSLTLQRRTTGCTPKGVNSKLLTLGTTLGQWVRKQRQNRARLNNERVDQLESFPRWTWNVIESTWDDKMATLVDWLAAHDQVYPRRPSGAAQERQLATWVDNQIQCRAQLEEERTHSLEALHGWQWRVSEKACCFLLVDSYTRCDASCNLKLAPNNLH